MREEHLELVKKLRGKGFIVRQNQRRAIQRLDHLRHREGLAGTGDAEQDLMLLAGLDAGHEFFDGAALIAPRLVVAD